MDISEFYYRLRTKPGVSGNVLDLVQDYIECEDPKEPSSDAGIADYLYKFHGLDVSDARITLARKILNIPIYQLRRPPLVFQ